MHSPDICSCVYKVADELHEELKALGVFVNEKVRGWRADGKAFPTHVRVPGDGDDDVALAAALDEPMIGQLLEQRALHRKEGEYDEADELVRQLLEEFSVVLDDKKGTWRLVVRRGGYYHVGPEVDEFTYKKVCGAWSKCPLQ